MCGVASGCCAAMAAFSLKCSGNTIRSTWEQLAQTFGSNEKTDLVGNLNGEKIMLLVVYNFSFSTFRIIELLIKEKLSMVS